MWSILSESDKWFRDEEEGSTKLTEQIDKF
jgi:hypothetical protein